MKFLVLYTHIWIWVLNNNIGFVGLRYRSTQPTKIQECRDVRIKRLYKDFW